MRARRWILGGIVSLVLILLVYDWGRAGGVKAVRVSARASEITCKGSHDASEWEERTCLLRNVCLGDSGEILLFGMEKDALFDFVPAVVEPNLPEEYQDDYLDCFVHLGRKIVNGTVEQRIVRGTWNNPLRSLAKLLFREESVEWWWPSVPSPLVSGRVYAWGDSAPFYAVRASEKYPEDWDRKEELLFYHLPVHSHNFGHLLFDSVLSAFRAAELFGFEDVKVSSSSTCEEFSPFSYMPRRCEKNWKKVLPVFGQQDLPIFRRRVCFDRLLVGNGPGSFATISRNDLAEKFTQFVRSKLGVSEKRVKRKNTLKVCLLKKEGGQRSVMNVDEIHRAIALKYAVFEVESMVGFEKNTLKEEVERIGACDVLITAPGGASLMAAFLKRGAALIMLDFYDKSKNKSTPFDGEGRFWRHAKWLQFFRYSYGSDEVRMNCTGAEIWGTSTEYWITRKCSNVMVNVQRMLALVDKAVVAALAYNDKYSV